MQAKDLMLRDNANLIFQRGNKVYKLCICITSGVITLEELHKDSTEKDLIQVFTLPPILPCNSTEEHAIVKEQEEKENK